MGITIKDKEKIKELSKNQDIFNLITNSIIPSIHGHNDIKEVIALQLFGGVSKEINNQIRTPGKINVLIVGDPGIGKSHLLKGVSKLASNGICIDSNKSNVNGLHQHLSDTHDLQNLDESIYNLENVLICIDSLVVKPDNVIFLKEALGKKSNFNTKEELLNILNSRCSVLAASNPKFGRFDRYKSIAEQINIPLTILSCFDLIFVVEDKTNFEEDQKLAIHILKSHKDNKINSEIDQSLLKKYIAYARDEIHPKLTGRAIEMLKEYFIAIRQGGCDEDLVIPITARQLESLIKLSEANARIRLSDEITSHDVGRVINIYQNCLKQVGYDPEIGNLNNYSLFTGPKTEINIAQMVIEVIKEIENQYGGMVPTNIFINEISNRYNLDKNKVKEMVKMLKERGLIFEPLKGFLKLV